MQGIGRLANVLHLARRFFGHVRAKPLTDDEAEAVRDRLDEQLASLFFTMVVPDQRHAFDVYERSGPDNSIAVAALMHDIGKSAAPLGAMARAFATLGSAIHIPLRGAWAMYRDHAAIGAAMLQEAGADPFAIAFAKGHPGAPPEGVDADAWWRLAAADHI